MNHYVGIDIGGTTSTIAVADDKRNVIHVSEQFESRTADGPTQAIQAIYDQIKASLESLGIETVQVEHLALATPGPASLDGVLLNTPNFPTQEWDRFPFRAGLEEKFRECSPKAAVHYIGDGQAAALGEYAIRTGSIVWDQVSLTDATKTKISSLFMSIVGTGLGGGEVRSGMAVCGKEGRAGHAGHIFLPAYAFRYDHDRELVVGNAKCTVESAVSLTALTHQLGYRLGLSQWKDHPLNSQTGSAKDKAKQLRGLAAEEDPLAQELFLDQARALGIGLLAVNYLGDYDLLVVGGGVCDLAPAVRNRYLETVKSAYCEFALDGFRNLDCLDFSVCGDESPVIGALAIASMHGKD